MLDRRGTLLLAVFVYLAALYCVRQVAILKDVQSKLNFITTKAPSVEIESMPLEKYSLPLRDITPFLVCESLDSFHQTMNISNAAESMFFLVTTGKAEMSMRQACSVESSCVHNPLMTMVVVFVLPATQLLVAENEALVGVARRCCNVRLATVNATAAILAAGLHRLAALIPNGSHPVEHLSDVLRVLLVRRFGGFYSDLDVLMLHGLATRVATDNFVVADTEDYFASCLFGLKRNHTLATKILETMDQGYKNWEYVFSPFMFSAAIQEHCNNNESRLLIKEQKCTHNNDVAIFNSSLIGPWEYPGFQNYLDDVTEEAYIKSTSNCVAFHLFNKLTASKELSVRSRSPYVRAAKHFCPLTFSLCNATF